MCCSESRPHCSSLVSLFYGGISRNNVLLKDVRCPIKYCLPAQFSKKGINTEIMCTPTAGDLTENKSTERKIQNVLRSRLCLKKKEREREGERGRGKERERTGKHTVRLIITSKSRSSELVFRYRIRLAELQIFW